MSLPITLTELLSPFTVEQFFQSYWRKQVLHVQRRSSDFYERVLALGDLDRHFQSRQLAAAFLNVSMLGKNFDPSNWSRWEQSQRGESVRVADVEKLLALYARGGTLILNQAHNAFPSISEFCRQLSRETGIQSGANIYLAPARAQGFLRHGDSHDICVMQVRGSKTWQIYGELEAELTLQAGDLLYVPLGTEHSVHTGESASIHLSLGLEPVCGSDLMVDLLELARHSPGLREPVFAYGAQTESVGELRGWLTEVDLSALAQARLKRARDRSDRGQRLQDLLVSEELTGDSVVSSRLDGPWAMEEREGRLHFLAVDLSLHPFAEPAVARLREGQSCRVRELPGFLTPQDKLGVVKELVRAGLLRIDSVR